MKQTLDLDTLLPPPSSISPLELFGAAALLNPENPTAKLEEAYIGIAKAERFLQFEAPVLRDKHNMLLEFKARRL
jgi:hypothetical protein